MSPYNSPDYNVQFSLSSEILAPSYIHPPTLEPSRAGQTNGIFVSFIYYSLTYYQYIEMVLIANTLHLQAAGPQ